MCVLVKVHVCVHTCEGQRLKMFTLQCPRSMCFFFLFVCLVFVFKTGFLTEPGACWLG